MTDPIAEPANDEASSRRLDWPKLVLALSLVANAALVGVLLADRDNEADTAEVSTPSEADDRATTLPSTTLPSTTSSVPAATTTSAAPAAATDGEDPVRVFVAGDSIAAQIGWALQGWSEANPGRIVVFNESHIGCGVVRYGQKRVDGLDGPVGDVCSNWNDPVALQVAAEDDVVSWPSALELFRPDIALSIVSSWDATDRIVPGVVDDWTSIGDPTYDEYVLGEYTQATSVLSTSGAEVFWLMSPYLNKALLPDDHRDRVDGLNELVTRAIDTVAADRADATVNQIDYPGWIGETGGTRDQALRDDGVHLSDVGLEQVVPWLLAELGLTDEEGTS